MQRFGEIGAGVVARRDLGGQVFVQTRGLRAQGFVQRRGLSVLRVLCREVRVVLGFGKSEQRSARCAGFREERNFFLGIESFGST